MNEICVWCDGTGKIPVRCPDKLRNCGVYHYKKCERCQKLKVNKVNFYRKELK